MEAPGGVNPGSLDEGRALAEAHALAEDALKSLETLLASHGCTEAARPHFHALREALHVAHLHAHTDGLTGLMNRACFSHALAPALARAERAAQPAALVFIDLDDFKLVNDELGHAAGDHVLTWTARRIKDSVREGDLVARFGGDEFVVFMENVSNDDARTIAERAVAGVEAPCTTPFGTRFVTASVGVALYPDHGRTAAELLRHADRAMYRVKSFGGAGCNVYASAPPPANKSSVSGAFPSLYRRVKAALPSASATFRSHKRRS